MPLNQKHYKKAESCRAGSGSRKPHYARNGDATAESVAQIVTRHCNVSVHEAMSPRYGLHPLAFVASSTEAPTVTDQNTVLFNGRSKPGYK